MYDEAIIEWLNQQRPAVSGQGGHMTTFRVGCQLFSKWRLTPTQGFQYLSIYNKRCIPPWSFKELKHKVHDTYVRVYGPHAEEDKPYNRLDYETAEWAALRKEVLARANGVCEMCGSVAETAHHLTYRFGVLCPSKFLMAVCWGCHEEVHGNYRVPVSRKIAEWRSRHE
jgi:Fe-S cluster biogenesis protein NfuA